jgi:Na+/melibiose symporter-like transporter
MVIGLFAASTVIGRRVSRTGRYKPYMLAGTILLTLGLALMGTLDETTSLIELGAFMVTVGAGLGMLMQNLCWSCRTPSRTPRSAPAAP